ncbi:MAG TPA: universal stress protein [Candidatus Cybelea sp.]|nr:universal stress protein [Candidatus Cybelea sp.]
MATMQNILFPVDFSPSCVAMSAYVKRAAAILGARVTLVHVFDLYSHDATQLYVRPLSEVAEEQQKVARDRLESFLKSEFPRAECPRVLLSGDAATQITQLARKNGFDLIVMPTHAGVFRRALLGSTTAKVLNHADCPVLTTQHAETISPRQLEHREWVCAIGLDSDSQRVLRYASQVAQVVHANLSLVHAIPASGPELPVELDLQERLQSEKREVASRRIAELQSAAGSHARVSIAIGPIKDLLTEAARRWHADVLVIGRSPQSGVLGRLRDLSYAVARDAPCPVLSV